MYKRILIPTDFSEASRPAIGKAIQIARLCGAFVQVVHVISDLEDAFQASVLSRAAQIEREAKLETNLDLALPDEAYPGVKKSLLWGASIPGEILKHAQKENFDLIVCGSHGRGLVGRTLLGSVAQELSRASSIPVLIVPASEQPSFADGIQKILVPVDFSLVSLDAVDYAIRLAMAFHSRMILLHAIPDPIPAAMPDIYPITTIEVFAGEELRRQVRAEFHRLLIGRTLPANSNIEINRGDPAEEILRYAVEEHCSCVVMGTHGRKGLAAAILGSVTRSVLARTKVPVFTMAAHM